MNTAISESLYDAYAVIEEADIALVRSWQAAKMGEELYTGKDGGYMAAARDGDRAYCAQYIDDFETD